MSRHLIKILAFSSLFTILSCSLIQTTTKTSEKKESSNPKINRENYYDYYFTSKPFNLVTNWLTRNEAVPIIVEELDKLGYKTFTFRLYELPDSSHIIVDVYNRDKDLGIVFNTGHIGSVEKKQRNMRTFNQIPYKAGGQLGKLETYKNLPENIIVIQETWYWYQYGENTNSADLLNKSTIIEILREDIRAFVKEFESKK